MDARARRQLVGWLTLAALVSSCGGRANKHGATPNGGAGTGGANAPQGGRSAAGAVSAGMAQMLGGAPEPNTAGAAPGGVGTVEGGAPSEGGAGGWAGEASDEQAGAGGAGEERPSVDALLGDYDVYLASPPAVDGCTVAWYEPRINLAVYRNGPEKLQVLPFADFFWQANFAKAPAVGASTIVIAAQPDWADLPVTPALELGWDANGFAGGGSAEIPYTCQGGVPTTRTVSVTIGPDHTSPQLRVEAGTPPSFGFTKFGFTFSEPVTLPSGDYGITFSEPGDGERALELYDLDTNAALATAWKWSLAGPIAQARFLDPASVEGLTIAARLVTPIADRAGNPLVTLDQAVDIEPSAVLDTAIDFDQPPAAGRYGNASYHPAAEPGAACEQGGCLVLDGPLVACYGAPQGGFAVRLTSSWEKLQLRYRVWASTSSVSPLAIGYASGCTGFFSSSLKLLGQPDGAFSYASDWQTSDLAPCGGPENENGFTVSLACAEYEPAPYIRVVVEGITRPALP